MHRNSGLHTGSLRQRSLVGSGMMLATAPRTVASRHMGAPGGPSLWASKYQGSIGSSQTGHAVGDLAGSYLANQHLSWTRCPQVRY